MIDQDAQQPNYFVSRMHSKQNPQYRILKLSLAPWNRWNHIQNEKDCCKFNDESRKDDCVSYGAHFAVLKGYPIDISPE